MGQWWCLMLQQAMRRRRTADRQQQQTATADSSSSRQYHMTPATAAHAEADYRVHERTAVHALLCCCVGVSLLSSLPSPPLQQRQQQHSPLPAANHKNTSAAHRTHFTHAMCSVQVSAFSLMAADEWRLWRLSLAAGGRGSESHTRHTHSAHQTCKLSTDRASRLSAESGSVRHLSLTRCRRG